MADILGPALRHYALNDPRIRALQQELDRHNYLQFSQSRSPLVREPLHEDREAQNVQELIRDLLSGKVATGEY
jgi:hypothetical protein